MLIRCVSEKTGKTEPGQVIARSGGRDSGLTATGSRNDQLALSAGSGNPLITVSSDHR